MTACTEVANSNSSGRFGPDSGGRANGQVSRNANGFATDPGGVSPGALQRGTDQFINTDEARRSGKSQALVLPAGGQKVELSLLNAGIEAAAKAVLGDTLKLNYVIADGVTGRITIQTTGPIPKQALLDLFEAALSANGATLEHAGGVYRIVSGSTGNRTFRLAKNGAGEGASILVAPLEYVSASEMVNLLQPLVEDGLKVVPDKNRNLLLMSGPATTLEAALDALNLFDVDVLQGKSVALVRLRAAEPDDIVQELTTIFETEAGGALNGVVEFVPNQRLGSVLIISTKAKYMDRAKRWIRELDQTAAGSSQYLHTYQLKNRNATEIAPILASLLSAETSGGDSGGVRQDVDTDASGGVSGNSQNTNGPAARVAADASRNALVIKARRAEHTEIQNLLRELDSAARQVLLEATIAEVTLNDEIDVGVRWFFESGNWDFNYSDLETGAVAGSNPGFSAVFGGGSARVALSALSSVTDVKVISSPTLMVVDNREGILQIGDQVPVATQTSTVASNEAVVLTQVEYRDTGIILRVKPRVGANGRVNLEIEQEVSDVSATRTSGIDSPTISTRKVKTSAVLTDGQTLALGGLIQEADNKTRAQVPGLGNVPVVGNLFRTRDSKKKRTELLILIRPRVVYDDQQAAAVTRNWRNKLAGADSILQSGLGSPRHSVQDIVR
ncbi:MAG: type II secretion system secretin GspD [Sulfitobacter sp.]